MEEVTTESNGEGEKEWERNKEGREIIDSLSLPLSYIALLSRGETLNLVATLNTLLCGWRFEHAKLISLCI